MTLPRTTFNKKFNTQHGRCLYCGCNLNNCRIEIDHKIPFSKSKDGRNSNLWLVCYDCNRQKSDKYIYEFKIFIDENHPEKLIRGMFYFEFIGI